MNTQIPTIASLYLASPHITYPNNLPAWKVELGLVSLPDDGGSGRNIWLLGQSFFAEAFTSAPARDARLGPAHECITFKPLTYAEAENGGAEFSDVAIGPALGEEGFETIAEVVLTAKLERERELGARRLRFSLIIARLNYVVHTDNEGILGIFAYPLYTKRANEAQIEATAAWLQHAIAAQLRAQPERLANEFSPRA